MPRVEIIDADVTTLGVDAITNAANTSLVLGAGVAGAVRRAGGPSIQEECDALAPIALGDAVATSAGDLPCRWVIHAATMGTDGITTAQAIADATASTLRVAAHLRCASLALVAFGTGVGGFELDRCAEIMCAEVREALRDRPDVPARLVFALRGDFAVIEFTRAAAGVGLLDP